MLTDDAPEPDSTAATTSGTTPGAMPDAMPERRRTRQRRELVDEICTVARRQLTEGGATAVSWRGIAREVGMGPASLYTYFPSLDALFTELIVRSFRSLAGAVADGVETLGDAPIGDRLLAGPLAYRAWALAHPHEFNLVFTDQLPGYAATPGGPTVEAQTEIFRPMAAMLHEARIAQGRVADPRADPMESATADDITLFLGLWGLLHGLVSLEVNHHLGWVDAPAVFEDRLRHALRALDLPAAAPDTAARVARLTDRTDRTGG